MPKKEITINSAQREKLKCAIDEAEKRVLKTLFAVQEYKFSDQFLLRVGQFTEKYLSYGYFFNISPGTEVFDVESKLGHCKTVSNNGQADYPLTHRIGVNVRLLEDNVELEYLVNTLVHEYFHSIADNLAIKYQGHKGYWLNLASVYNVRKLGTLPVKREKVVPNMRKSEYKYILECPNCHTQIGYHRMSNTVKNSDNYICRKCKVKLVRVK